MFNKQPVQVTEVTFTDRINAATVLAGNALSVFHEAAADLEEAAQAQAIVADEIQAEITRLGALRDHAQAQTHDAITAATNVRSLIG